jgi:hypothetical protein
MKHITSNNELDTRMLTEGDVAQMLTISLASVRRRRLLNQPPMAIKVGRSVRYRLTDVLAFVDECPKIGR